MVGILGAVGSEGGILRGAETIDTETHVVMKILTTEILGHLDDQLSNFEYLRRTFLPP